MFLRPQEYERKLRRAVEVLALAAEPLTEVLASPDFGDDLRRLQLELFDSGVACQRSIAEATHIRQAARAVVELHASMVESAGVLVGAPLLTAAGQKTAPYASLRRGNATGLVSDAQKNADIAGLFAGLDTHVRTAQAHRRITYGDAAVGTDLKSGQREYDYDGLVDMTFEAMESILAGLMAIKIVRLSVDWTSPVIPGWIRLASPTLSPSSLCWPPSVIRNER